MGLKKYNTDEERLEAKRVSNKRYRENNKEKIKNKNAKYVIENKEKINEKSKTYYISNKNKKIEYYNKTKELTKEQKLEYAKEYRKNNPNYHKEYYQKNKETIKKQNVENEKKRLKNDPLFKLKKNIRNLIRQTIKRNNFKKNTKTFIILGCDPIDFKLYLESKFEPWMNWNNYGLYNGTLNYGWDIDHIIPSSNAITEEELIKLNNYTNLQPLCGYYNRNVKRNV